MMKSATTKSLTKAVNAVNVHILSFWDAILWAVACEAGVTLLLSEDFQHDRVLDGIRFFNPFKLAHPINYIFNINQSESTGMNFCGCYCRCDIEIRFLLKINH